MITIKGKQYRTISDAAGEFGVSVKTVWDWVDKQIIGTPPTIEHGARSINIFPPDFMKECNARLAAHRKRKGKSERNSIGSSNPIGSVSHT